MSASTPGRIRQPSEAVRTASYTITLKALSLPAGQVPASAIPAVVGALLNLSPPGTVLTPHASQRQQRRDAIPVASLPAALDDLLGFHEVMLPSSCHPSLTK